MSFSSSHLYFDDLEIGQELLPLTSAPVKTNGNRRRGKLGNEPGLGNGNFRGHLIS